MKKLISLYRSYLPILILLVYSIGYFFLYNYYLKFGIEIVFFYSLTDILFSALDLLTTFIFIIIIFEIVLWVISSFIFAIFSSKETLEIKDDNKNKIEPNKIESSDALADDLNFSFLSLVIAVITLSILMLYTDQGFLFGVMLFTLLPIKFYYLIGRIGKGEGDEDDEEFGKIKTGMSVLLIVVLFIGAYFFGINAAEDMKNGENPFLEIDVEFYDNDKFYSTSVDSTKLFIGQSSECIFLYNLNDEKTSVFYKNNLKELKFLDPTKQIENDLNEKLKNFKKLFNINDSIEKK